MGKRIDARSMKDEERGNVGGKTNGRSWGSQVGTFDTSRRHWEQRGSYPGGKLKVF